MKKIVVEKPKSDYLTIDDLIKKFTYSYRGYSFQGILVKIYNNRINILTPYPSKIENSGNYAAFLELGKYDGYNTATETPTKVIERLRPYVESGTEELYWFENAEDFAKAILKNKWRLYNE